MYLRPMVFEVSMTEGNLSSSSSYCTWVETGVRPFFAQAARTCVPGAAKVSSELDFLVADLRDLGEGARRSPSFIRSRTV